MSEPDERDASSAPPPVHPVPLSPSHPVAFGIGRLSRLVRKELSEILRDRRTILTLVLMPLLLYPLLAMAFPQFLLGLGGEARGELAIGVPAPTETESLAERRGGPLTEGSLVKRYLHFGLARPAARLAGAAAAPAGSHSLAAVPVLLTWREAGPTALPLPPRFDPLQRGGRPPPQLMLYLAPDLEDAVRSGQVDLGIRLRRPRPRGRGLRMDWELIYRANSPNAPAALALVERLAVAANADVIQERLRQHGDPTRAAPVRLLRRPLVEADSGGLRVSLTALIPLVLILMTITGAVYPAIDLTAGERERGTLEILVAAPVPRLALLFAKYVSVVTVAVLTATVNLVMMILTLQVSGLAGALGGALDMSPTTVLEVFGLLLLFAAFFSAVLLVLTSFARSFKEAQAYLIPLMLVSLAPGVAGMLPGLRLTGMYTITPLLNIVLLGRDLFAGEADAGAAAAVVFSTVVYAAAALSVAARIFGAESVLYSEQGAWSDLFRRPAQPRAAATAAGALLGLALLFPLYYFALHGLIAPAAGEGHGPELLLMQAAVTLLLFVGLPLLAAVWGRLRVRDAFELRAARWPAFVAAVLLGVSLIPPIYELLALLRRHGLTFLGPEAERRLQAVVEQWRSLPAAFVAGSLALMGAAEELFFRGYLFSALRRAGGARTAILGSAALFGLFHFASAFDRLVPSTLMGLVLGWVCWRTGSVLPGMLLHALYDAASALLAHSRVGQEGATGLPLEWVALGLVGTAVGVALISFAGSAPQGQFDAEARQNR